MEKQIIQKLDEIILLLENIDSKLNASSEFKWGNGPKDIHGNPLPYVSVSNNANSDK